MRRTALLVGLAFVCAAACSKSGTTAPANSGTGSGNTNPGNTGGTDAPPPNTVDATPSLTFTPTPLTVTVGTSVNFVFGTTGHNVTFNAVAGRPADIPGTNANTTIAVVFNTAGTFPYQCTIHAGMTGTIIVQ
jgi:plastocyanin